MKIAVFPGSFDPFTIGHESIVLRSVNLFDKIIIGVGLNTSKSGFLSMEKRMLLISDIFKNVPNVEVKTYSGLTTDFCKENNAVYLLRGLRTSADFEYERAIAQVNKVMYPELETVFILTLPEHSAISSSIVREIIKHKGNARMFVSGNIDYDFYFNTIDTVK